ncbi:hypothetical protein D3C71_1716060 [compost metagenome]
MNADVNPRPAGERGYRKYRLADVSQCGTAQTQKRNSEHDRRMCARQRTSCTVLHVRGAQSHHERTWQVQLRRERVRAHGSERGTAQHGHEVAALPGMQPGHPAQKAHAQPRPANRDGTRDGYQPGTGRMPRSHPQEKKEIQFLHSASLCFCWVHGVRRKRR